MSPLDPSASFHLAQADDGVVIAVGEIDMVAGPQLEALVLPLERPGAVVIDLSAVTFLDSSGLRTLLKIARAAGERGDEVVLRSPSAEVDRLLELTGTREQFTFA
ncbi:MAG: STAS domain-containing protein [Ilumatobacteraceae bacterium]